MPQNTEIPFIVYESEAIRNNSIIKKLILVIAILILLLFGSNLSWIVYMSQFENVVETTSESYSIEQDTEQGCNNCIIKGGEIINGKTNN